MEDNNLEDFKWADKGLGDETPPTQDPEPPVNEPPTEVPPTKEPDIPPAPKEEDEPPKKSEEPSTDPDAQSLYEDWKNAGLIQHLEFEEGVPVTQESLLELIQADRDAEVQAQLENYFKELNPGLKNLITYVQNGGDMNEYFGATQTEFDIKGNLKDVNYQKQVIRHYEKRLGSTDEEINELITLLDTGSKTEQRATKYLNLLKEEQTKQIAAMEKEQQAAAQRSQLQLQQHITQINTELKKDNILGVKLSAKDKTELSPYLIERNVKLDNGINVTQFQYDLQEQLADPAKLVFIANLVKNKLNLDKFIKNYTTQATQYFRTKNKQTNNNADDGSSNPFAAMNNFLN